MALPWEDYQNTTATEEPPKPWESYAPSLEPQVVTPQEPSTTQKVIGAINEGVGVVQQAQSAVLNPAALVTDRLVPESVNRFMKQGLVSPETMRPAVEAGMMPARGLSYLLFGREASKEPLETTSKAISELASSQTSPENLAIIAGTAGLGAAEAGLAKRSPSLGEILFGERGTIPQAQPQISETPITDTVTQQPNTGGEINAEQISQPTQVNGDVLNAPRPQEIQPLPTAVSGEGVPTRGQGETLQAPQEVVQPVLSEEPLVRRRPEDPVVKAAYLMPDGTRYTGEEHMFILEKHPEIETNPKAISGFVTKSGKFLTEQELQRPTSEVELPKPITKEEMPDVMATIDRLAQQREPVPQPEQPITGTETSTRPLVESPRPGQIPEVHVSTEDVAMARYILEHNPIRVENVGIYSGQESTPNPNKQPQGYSQQVWKQAWNEASRVSIKGKLLKSGAGDASTYENVFQGKPSDYTQSKSVPEAEAATTAATLPKEEAPKLVTPPEGQSLPSGIKAAYKTESGNVYVSDDPTHAGSLAKAFEKEPAHEKGELGFVNDKGEFLNRTEAYDYVQKNKPEVKPITPEKPSVIPRSREEANQAAISLEKKDPEIGRKTVQRVIKTNSASDDIEQAVVMREFNKSREDYETAIDAVNSSPEGSPEKAVAMARLKETEKRFQDATDASYKSGTATARGLGFRAGNGEFSMARMLREIQAHNAGNKLPAEVIDTTRELSGKLNAVGDRMVANAELSKRTEALIKEYATKRASERVSTPARAATKSFLQDAADKAMERIAQRRSEGRLYAGIDPEALYDHAVIGANYLAKGVTTFSRWSAEMLNNAGEHVRPFLKDIYDQSKRVLEATLSTDKRLASYKKRLTTNYEKLKEKIDAGDFTKPERQKLAIDRETQNLRKEYDDLKNQWKKELKLRERVNTKGWRKNLDTATEYLRSEKLTGIGTLGKIASAATQRPIATALEDVAGRAATAIPTIRKIAQGAPTENPVLSSLGRYPAGIAKGIKEFPDIVRGKNEPAEYSARGPDVLQYPGRVHGGIKNPIKSAEYNVGQDRALKWAEREQLDPTEPEVSAQIHEFAKQRGLRSIWMNDNAASRLFRNAMSSLEHSGDAGFVASRVGRILLPIIRVPTNVAIEAGRYHFGLANASVRVAHGLVKGIDTLSPVQKDLIMSNLKKGSVGAGMFALGYIYHKQFGGFYNEATYKNKEKETGLRPLEAKLFGVKVPSWVAHSPLMLTLHAGATFHDMMETKHGTALGSEMAVLGGILENVPFVNEASRLDDIIRGGQYKAQKAIGGFFRSQAFPVMLQELARWTDQHDSNGHPIKRYPQSIPEEVKLGAPVLRQQVQETKPKSKGRNTSGTYGYTGQ